MTEREIIITALAIAGFAIVLIFLFMLNLGAETPEEICKLSVVSRATAPTAAQAAIPLKCKAEKICLTETSSSGCEDNFAGEEGVVYVKLSGNDALKALQIERESANAMYDCWNMMGQGKLDLFGSAPGAVGLIPAETTCVICSRVAVDKSVSLNVLKLVDINRFLRDEQVPGSSLTYLQTFTDRGVASYAKVDSDYKDASGQLSAEAYNEEIGTEFGKMDVGDLTTAATEAIATEKNGSREMAFVFMQIKAQGTTEALSNLGLAGATVAGGAFMSPAGKILSKALFTPWGAVIALGTAGGVAAYGAYTAEQGQLTAAAYCGEFSSTAPGEKAGCSMVQGINYNSKEINALCKSLQGEL